MADATEQLTGLFAPIVTAGAVVKVTQSLFGSNSPQQSKRKRQGKKANKRTAGGGGPWSGNPAGGSSPW